MKKIINLIYRLLCIILVIFLFIINNQYNKSLVEIKKLKKEISKNETYVFLGDSLTDYYKLQEFYPEYTVINSGISGNKTKDILDNLDSRVYRYKPNKVFLLIGINDLIHYKDVKDVENNIEKIAKNINKKFPKCDIYIESVYPINDDIYKTHYDSNIEVLLDKIVDLNDKIENYCKKNNFEYIDLYDSLIDEDKKLKKEYSDDGLHLNVRGYNNVTKILKEFLE